MTNDLVMARGPVAAAPLEPTWEMTWLSHIGVPAGQELAHDPGPVWIFVIAGEITLDTAAGARVLNPGDAVLIDARTAYRVTASGSEPAQLVVADLRAVMTPQRLPSPLAVTDFGAANAGIAALITMCPLEHECPPRTFATGYGNLIGAAMLSAWRARQGGDASADVPDDAVATVVAAVTAQPGQPWTVERMARLAHLSRSALAERFRRSLGLGPSELLREVRMREARRLLRDPARSIAHVAYAVGYGSTAAFSRAFSSQHGIGPQAWRAELRSRHAQHAEDGAGRPGGYRSEQQRARDPVSVQ